MEPMVTVSRAIARPGGHRDSSLHSDAEELLSSRAGARALSQNRYDDAASLRYDTCSSR
jgi:hypothetical protein